MTTGRISQDNTVGPREAAVSKSRTTKAVGKDDFAVLLERPRTLPTRSVAAPARAAGLPGDSGQLGIVRTTNGYLGIGTDFSLSGPALAPSAYDDIINAESKRQGIDPDLVRAVIQVESGFNPKAVSSAGAKGLMQLMDGTAAGLGVTNSFDPAQNIRGGTAFLAENIRRFGSVELGVAAYNAGPGAVEKYGGIPPYAETQAYVKLVMGQLRG